jgi:hypothetical protein
MEGSQCQRIQGYAVFAVKFPTMPANGFHVPLALEFPLLHRLVYLLHEILYQGIMAQG